MLTIVFMYQWGNSITVLPIYVDNKLLAGNDDSLLDTIQHSIGTCFKTSNLSTVAWILGICVWHDIAAGMLFID